MNISSKHLNESAGVLTNFLGGINRSAPPFLIGQNDLYAATNFFYDPQTGYLTTRPGLKKHSAAAIPAQVFGVYPLVISGQLTKVIAGNNQKLYYLDVDDTPVQITGTLSGTARPSFATMGGKLVVASGGIGQTWDGNPAHALTNNNSAVWQSFLASYGKKGSARILAVGDQTNLDRLTLSASLDPTDFDIVQVGEAKAKYIDAGYLDGAIATAIATFRGDTFVFKRTPKGEMRIAYRADIRGDSSAWTCLPMNGDYGPVNPFLLKELYKSLYFVDIEGPKRIDAVENFADLPYDMSPMGTKIAGNMRPFIGADGFSLYDKTFGLWMIKPSITSEIFYCMDIVSDRWTWFRFVPNITSGEHCDGKMLFGAADGFVYEYDMATHLDEGNSYPMVLETKWFNNSIEFQEMAKEKYLHLVGITAGEFTWGPKVQGVQKYQKTVQFGAMWEDWPYVNSILPEAWNESLTKTVPLMIADRSRCQSDYISFYISVNSGLCALAQLAMRSAVTGRS